MAVKSQNTFVWVAGAIVAFVVIVFVGFKLVNHFNRVYNMPLAGNTPSNSTTSGLTNKTDGSNTQLDKDVQDVQNSMNQLQLDQNTSNQDINSAAKDVPAQ